MSIEKRLAALEERVAKLERRRKTKPEEAVEWLQRLLAGGAVDREYVLFQANERGISKNALMRAKRELGLITSMPYGEPARWLLPRTK